ncbi:hypothetical protein H816_YJM1418N00145 [Saccharomyces cerevisiae YJM1418]|nr:hypothetical protein H816_YJM1418N00145 [Saccharomyces cerevisiae YJM1418]
MKRVTLIVLPRRQFPFLKFHSKEALESAVNLQLIRRKKSVNIQIDSVTFCIYFCLLYFRILEYHRGTISLHNVAGSKKRDSKTNSRSRPSGTITSRGARIGLQGYKSH